MTHKIRPGVPEDVEAREYVRVTTWKTAYRGIMPDDYLDALKVEPDAVAGMEVGLAGALAEGRTPLLVGETGGRIVGFVDFGRCRDEQIGGGEVFAIYVLPEAQAGGLGHALMTAAVDGHLDRACGLGAGPVPRRPARTRGPRRPPHKPARRTERTHRTPVRAAAYRSDRR